METVLKKKKKKKKKVRCKLRRAEMYVRYIN
jgi:hypothetical protein